MCIYFEPLGAFEMWSKSTSTSTSDPCLLVTGLDSVARVFEIHWQNMASGDLSLKLLILTPL